VLESRAKHIAGGQITYRCLGNDRYEVTLHFYRDCLDPEGAPFDDVLLFVFKSSDKQLVSTYAIPVPANTPRIYPPNPAACFVGGVPRVCLEEGIYKTIITLPPIVGGYDLSWARCCRNDLITNLLDSRRTGMTFLAHIPGSEVLPNECNSSPVFKRPPVFLCMNRVMEFDMSATDADGDSLVYVVSEPYSSENFQGTFLDTLKPRIMRESDWGPPPYKNVFYNPTYSYPNPFGSGGEFLFDRNTGNLTLKPPRLGLFVVAFSVFEYRDGKLLSENKFDIQFYVLNCKDLGVAPTISKDLSGQDSTVVTVDTTGVNDTLTVLASHDFCYTVTVKDTIQGAKLRAELLTKQGITGISITPTSSDNLIFLRICWKPACELIGQTVFIIIKAYDTTDCPGYNIVFDTLIIKIVAPPRFEVFTELSIGNNVGIGDSVYSKLGDTVCFPFKIYSAGGQGDSLLLRYWYNNQGAGNPPTVISELDGDTLRGTICGVTNCIGLGNPVGIVLEGVYKNSCPPNAVDSDTVWINIVEPYNPKPSLIHQFYNLPTVQDTVLVMMGTAVCYDYEIRDSLPKSRLGDIILTIEYLDGSPYFGNQRPILKPTYFQTDTLIKGQICWIPECEAVDKTVRIIMELIDSTICALSYVVRDTVYIRVNIQPNLPPILWVGMPDPILPVSNDTFQIIAREKTCFPFKLADNLLPKGNLLVQAYAQSINNLKDTTYQLTITGLDLTDSTVSGTICWQAECEIDKYFRIIIIATDSLYCRTDHELRDTLYFHILARLTEPIILIHNFLNNRQNGDTIWLPVKRNACFTATLVDTLNNGDLTFEGLGEIGNSHRIHSQRITISDTAGYRVLTAYFCWKPDCDQLGDTFRYVIKGTSKPDCAIPIIIYDTIYIIVYEPPNQPPIITRSVGNLVQLETGKGTCFDYIIIDPDTFTILRANGLSEVFRENFGYGSNASLSFSGTNPLIAKLCITPNCQIRRNSIEVIVGSYDSSLCTIVAQTFDTLVFRINDCGLLIPNVFTPNGDGMHDDFGPEANEGLSDYELAIYDRWGLLIFNNKSQRWNGSYNATQSSAGVYFYTIKYRFYSGTGSLIEGSQNGSVTLMR